MCDEAGGGDPRPPLRRTCRPRLFLSGISYEALFCKARIVRRFNSKGPTRTGPILADERTRTAQGGRLSVLSALHHDHRAPAWGRRTTKGANSAPPPGSGSDQPRERAACASTGWPMRARMAAYSAWNSAPSRLSHSSSDGVNGRGAQEIAGLGLGEDVDAEADVVPPVFVEFAMLVRERVKRRGAKRKHLTATARAQRGRQDDRTAVALDVAPKVRESATKADVIVHQDVIASGLDLSVERRLEGEAVEATRSSVPDRVGLHDRPPRAPSVSPSRGSVRRG